MAETQRKLLEVILNAMRPGTPENKVLKSITGQSGDDIPVTDPTNPSSLAGSGTLTRYLDDPDNITLRRDNLARFQQGGGPDLISPSGAPTFDPLEEAVRSKSVIEDRTTPLRIRGEIQRDPEGNVLRRVTNKGIETRVREAIKDKDTPTKEVSYGKRSFDNEGYNTKGTVTVPKFPEVEDEAAEVAREAQKLENLAASGRTPTGQKKAVKVVSDWNTGTHKVDDQGQKIKSPGNVENTEYIDQIFSEIGLANPKGGLDLGSPELDKMLSESLRTPKAPPKEKAVGPLTGGMRKPERAYGDIDFEGEAINKEIARINKDLRPWEKPGSKYVPIRQRAIEFGNAQNVNAYIQDVVSRFKEMFDVSQLGAARKQGSVASKLRDDWSKLSVLAEQARNPRVSREDRLKILQKIVDIDNKLTGTNRTLAEVGQDFRLGNIAKENMPGTSVKQSKSELDTAAAKDTNLDEIDFVEPSRNIEQTMVRSGASGRSPERLKADQRQARMENYQNAPRLPRPPISAEEAIRELTFKAAQQPPSANMESILLQALRSLESPGVGPRMGPAEVRAANQPLSLREIIVRGGPRNVEQLVGK